MSDKLINAAGSMGIMPMDIVTANSIMMRRKPDEVITRSMGKAVDEAADVDGYMQRWFLIRKMTHSDLENAYLHHFLRSDPEDMHCHPWDNTTVVINGGYIERTPEGIFHRKAGDIVHRKAADIHAIVEIDRGTTSLFLTGKKVREWGFYSEHGFVPWRYYRAFKAEPEEGKAAFLEALTV